MTNKFKKLYETYDKFLQEKDISEIIKESSTVGGSIPSISDEGLYDFLYQSTKAYVKLSINKDINRFNLLNTWIVRQFQNEYNPIHFHSGHISGAGYLMVPDNLGETIQKDKVNTHGNINFHHGSKHFMSSGYLSKKPKVGDFYLFPHYLYHSVNPFYSEGERRSLSFNAKVDDDIYQVYGQN